MKKMRKTRAHMKQHPEEKLEGELQKAPKKTWK